MASLLSRFRLAAQNRAAYRRMLAELSAYTTSELSELYLTRHDLPRLAYRTVYGA